MGLAYSDMVSSDMLPGGSRNAWLTTEGQEGFDTLGQRWEPYLVLGDGFKAIGYRRKDGMGYVLPEVNYHSFEMSGRWHPLWAHPNLGGRPGWFHAAFGSYATASCAASAFDAVYELERFAGNKSRCPDAMQADA